MKKLAGEANIEGRFFIADAGFNKQEHFELVHRYGGRAYFDFDSDSRHSGGKFPHYDEMFTLRKDDRDGWAAIYNLRNRIESTNHAIKTVFKREFRARKEIPRINEALALLAVYAVSLLPRLRLERNIDLAFADEHAASLIDAAIRPKRKRKSLEDPTDLFSA